MAAGHSLGRSPTLELVSAAASHYLAQTLAEELFWLFPNGMTEAGLRR
jgi:hypothetical protein